MDYTALVTAIVRVVELILIMFVIPWIKRKLDAETLTKTRKWVKIAVEAAEMIYTGSGMGEQKKAYVEQFLVSHDIVVDFDELNNLIESAVLEMKCQLDT